MQAECNTKEHIFTRDFLLIFLAGGFTRICNQMQGTIIPLYGNQLGFTSSMVGLTTTVCTIASLILRPLLGGMLDRYGRRGLVLVGTLLFVLATLFCGMTGSFAVLLALRAVQGLGFSAHTTALNTWATDILPEERMAEGIGYMGLTGSISMAIAPALALALSNDAQYAQGLNGAFLFGMVAMICLLLVRSADVKQSTQTQTTAYHGWERFWERSSLKPTCMMLFLSTCYAGLTTFLTTFALDKGFSSVEISIYFTVNAVAMALARMFGGRAMQRMGVRRGLWVACLLCAAAFLLIALAPQAWLLWLAGICHGFGYGTIYPMLNALAITNAPPMRRGTAMATFLTGMDIGIGFGAGFWGFFIDHASMEAMFFSCAVISLLIYGLYCRLLKEAT